MSKRLSYGNAMLPAGVRSRVVRSVNGLDVHLLEAGFDKPDRPALLLLHGFPELAYSWRRVMLPLASAGYHVIAPDRRGYGGTTGWHDGYDVDLRPFGMRNMATDALALVYALGRRQVEAVIGHDFGSPVAAWCALIRPDVFKSVAMMSAPFSGAPALPFDTAGQMRAPDHQQRGADMDALLAALPLPRKHYMRYYASREANDNMINAPQGLHAFLRAYFHYKSADWARNQPFPLKSWSAEDLARLPTYYVMDLAKGMAETVASEMPSAAEIAACRWLPESELAVYVEEFGRTGFQGALQAYRCLYDANENAELALFSGRTIDVPSTFIAGRRDWGVYQSPGALDAMSNKACTRFAGVHLVEGAGHWVQQEQPDKVAELLLRFLREQS